jgi:hypothetical protein
MGANAFTNTPLLQCIGHQQSCCIAAAVIDPLIHTSLITGVLLHMTAA